MKKRGFIQSDSDYFHDSEDHIKLDFCAEGGNKCRNQMALMNEDLLLARRLIENKEFTRGIKLIEEAYNSTFELKEQQCLGCADLFRATITHSLNTMIQDLEQMTKGFLGSKKFLPEVERAKKVLQELKEKRQDKISDNQ